MFKLGKTQFDMEINQFADLTDEEFLQKYASGIKVSANRSNKAMQNIERLSQQVEARSLADAGIPINKNWFEEGKVTRPLDQAGCGACWAFSTSAAVESLAVISGREKELQRYSI